MVTHTIHHHHHYHTASGDSSPSSQGSGVVRQQSPGGYSTVMHSPDFGPHGYSGGSPGYRSTGNQSSFAGGFGGYGNGQRVAQGQGQGRAQGQTQGGGYGFGGGYTGTPYYQSGSGPAGQGAQGPGQGQGQGQGQSAGAHQGASRSSGGNVTHHEHHHHHVHHHYHLDHGPIGPQAQQLSQNMNAYRGPNPQQHFQTNVQHDGQGLDYWGNFGADWGYATGSGTGYYGGRQFGGSGSADQGRFQNQGQSRNPVRQAFDARYANTGYPFTGGYGQGYGNYGGRFGGTRGYAGSGYSY